MEKKFWSWSIIFGVLLLLLFSSCQKHRPTVSTESVTNIQTNQATSGGKVLDDGNASVRDRGVCWSTNLSPTITDNKTSDGSGMGSFTSSITQLSPNTLYYVRAFATNSEGTSYGSEVSFTTSPVAPVIPTLTTTTVTSITQTTAASGGNITSDGGSSVISRGVCWSTTTGPTIADNTTSNATGPGIFVSNITGLTANTKYYVKAYATNSVGTAYGDELTFTTNAVVTTVPGAPTGVSATAGNAQATITFTAPGSNGGSAITGYTVTSSPGGFTGTGSASPITVTGLTNGTAYTFTVIATNANGNSSASSASNSVTPSSVPGAPTIGTATAGNAQANVAFTVPASNGGSAITGYTVTSNPGNITGTGSASPIIVTGLTNGTVYTFTVIATNSTGNSSPSSASNSVTPSTIPGAPTGVSATAGNAQATITFIAPGSNGSAITGYTVTSSPGGFTGTFTSPISVTGLLGGTAYTFTVTATNANGTGPASSASNSVTPPVTDGDGNVYNTITIGNQVWMKENLKTTKYNDGTSIPFVADSITWVSLNTPGYCWYNNDITTYKDPYGALYNWYTVNTGTLCPMGWHVPYDSEWHTLILYLDPAAQGGMDESYIAGGKMKESGTTHWASPNNGATNESGFTALPGGWRGSNGRFLYMGTSDYYISATESICRSMDNESTWVIKGGTANKEGLSVRCLRDY